MTAVHQTIYEKGRGNCLTACVASILELPIEALPEFCVDGEWFNRLVDFCEKNGFSVLYWEHDTEKPILCLNAFVILLLELEGCSEIHAVVAKTHQTNLKVLPNGDTSRSWDAVMVHDPNKRGVPPVKRVIGFIHIGR